MEQLYFISGNLNKIKEIRIVFPEAESLVLDLPEIQELDPKKIIEEKLKEARIYHSGRLFCEDTSLYFDCLNGFPGPLIKWLLQSLGNKRIYEMVSHYSNHNATAKTIIGYNDGNKIYYFEGVMRGKVVEPKGEDGFGWNALFQPEGYDKTLAEMAQEEKSKINMRYEALIKMKRFIVNQPL